MEILIPNVVKTLVLTFIVSLVFPITVNSYESNEDGGGTSIYASVRGFLDELGKVAEDVSSGVKKLVKGVKQVQEFLDSTVEENCLFECPDGSKPRRNPDHIATSNGCGSFGLEKYLSEDMLPTSEFVSCCDSHDLCYGKCLKDKDDCDLKFKKCLYKVCSNKKETLTPLRYKGCQAGAKLLYTGTTALGCQPFINAQREACLCPNQRYPKKDEF